MEGDIIEEQHPIPQDISSYQFRLVGDMTLKQFLQVAAGALIALLFYSSPLHGAIKWPLAIISLIMGIALAFLPIDDRPLSTWIIAFFRSIYSPTIFVWRRALLPIQIFQPEPSAIQLGAQAQLQKAVQAQPVPVIKEPEPVEEVMSGTIYKSEEEAKALTELEHEEQKFLTKMSKLFSMGALLGKVPKGTPGGTTQAVKKPEDINVPEPITLTVVPKKEPIEPKAYKKVDEEKEKFEDVTEKVAPTLTHQFHPTDATIQAANYYDEASPPSPPEKENVVVGQVLDNDGKILEGAILEIKDENGRPVRALKTNKLGHFMIVTPLLDGKYELFIEKEGFTFDPISFNAQGKIIQPILIRATGRKEHSETEVNVN